MRPKPVYQVAITAIIALTIIEVAALINGINGQLFAGVIGAICLLAGVEVDLKKITKGGKNNG